MGASDDAWARPTLLKLKLIESSDREDARGVLSVASVRRNAKACSSSMTSLLPSQRQAQVFVGPNGLLVRQEPRQISEEEEEATNRARRRWRRAQKGAILGEEIDDDQAAGGTAASVVSQMQAAVRSSTHGISSTREVTSKLAESLAHAKLFASHLEGPGLLDSLDEQMQVECLCNLSLEAAATAARVCTTWRDFFEMDETIWERLVAAAPGSCVKRDLNRRRPITLKPLAFSSGVPICSGARARISVWQAASGHRRAHPRHCRRWQPRH